MRLFDALMACSDHHRQAALGCEATAGRAPEATAWKHRKRMRKHMAFAQACAKAAEIVARKAVAG